MKTPRRHPGIAAPHARVSELRAREDEAWTDFAQAQIVPEVINSLAAVKHAGKETDILRRQLAKVSSELSGFKITFRERHKLL